MERLACRELCLVTYMKKWRDWLDSAKQQTYKGDVVIRD